MINKETERQFTCEVCGCTFNTESTETEMKEEFEDFYQNELYEDWAESDLASLCDACQEEFLWRHKNMVRITNSSSLVSTRDGHIILNLQEQFETIQELKNFINTNLLKAIDMLKNKKVNQD